MPSPSQFKSSFISRIAPQELFSSTLHFCYSHAREGCRQTVAAYSTKVVVLVTMCARKSTQNIGVIPLLVHQAVMKAPTVGQRRQTELFQSAHPAAEPTPRAWCPCQHKRPLERSSDVQ